ncbi:MAG: hypothetical protein Q9217_005156 [Psora testacea]
MPALLCDMVSEPISLEMSRDSPYVPPHQAPQALEEPSSKAKSRMLNGVSSETHAKGRQIEGVFFGQSDGTNSGLHSLPNGRPSSSTESIRENGHARTESNVSTTNGSTRTSHEVQDTSMQANGKLRSTMMDTPMPSAVSKPVQTPGRRSLENTQGGKGWHKGHGRAHSSSEPKRVNPTFLSSIEGSPSPSDTTTTNIGNLTPTANKPLPSMPANPSPVDHPAGSSTPSLHPTVPRLYHRHTLEVPRVSTSRTSRDFSYPNTASDVASDSGRFTPTLRTPRASNTLARAPTRSIHSDMYLDEIPPDGDMTRWTETIRQKRASRRKRKEEEEEDRVVVGTKVDMNHVNWVTAYNMLTGIRFTVSRTNAKINRELTDADFDARHKFSFDITGNELTPSAKYDFKFKDYAPWVFRHLRAKFQIDPADYLMSLTSKYILSELGSPGKSGSFFYFSRDYKYIIKTIHHAEHKLLRKILREYYAHIEKYPNTLISQFYGLHRVKIPYGRKIHFVVMNNLFPPHRDIHQTFDLKGSTVGRDYKETDLERNPRATLKDLNWLRRNYHFEFGPQKKTLFIEQMKRDVALLQKLKIMDYSLLVGIHDLTKGNEENLRDKTLQVFQPGGDDDAEPQVKMLTRTPSKLENARQARQLRQIIKKEKPVPMDKSTNKMPDEMLEERKNFIFYGDDGGFRATHEDDSPGEEIYYLGIIDCLTHYGLIKRAEHLWKGMSNNKSQISPIPPESYGDRFVKFISGLTMSKEEVERAASAGDQVEGSVHPSSREPSFPISRQSTEKVVKRAEKQAHKSEKEGVGEEPSKDRTMGVIRSPSAERSAGVPGATLPVVEEDGEGGSREESIRDEKSQMRIPSNTSGPHKVVAEDAWSGEAGLPLIPNFNRLSMGLESTATTSAPQRESRGH